MDRFFSAGAGWMRRRGAMAGLAIVGATALVACGSSSKPAVSAAGTPLQQACASVAAVLGNGPDPGDDPIGYAEAQILPLLTVQTSDGSLHHALSDLSAAYKQFDVTKGSAASKAAVKQASDRVDAVCPGAAS